MKDVTAAFTTLARDHAIAHDATVPQPMRTAPQPPALGEGQATLTTLSGAAGTKQPPPRVPTRRRGWLFAALGVVAIGGAAGAIAVTRNTEHAEQPPEVAATPSDAAPARDAAAVVVTARDAAPAPDAASFIAFAVGLKRTSGELPHVKTALDVRLCIDATGKVTSVELDPGVDRVVQAEVTSRVSGWRFEPYTRAGVATAACLIEHLAPAVTKAAPRPGLPFEPNVNEVMTVFNTLHARGLACGGTATIGVKVGVVLHIDPAGAVVRVATANAPSPTVASCLEAVFKSARFPPSQYGGAVTVPFFFSQVTGAQPPLGSGRLTFRVTPPCKVTVDGRAVGTTPFPAIELTSGTHQVVLVIAEHAIREAFAVEIKPGGVLQINRNYTSRIQQQ